MDVFVEFMVKKKKSAIDALITVGIVILTLLLLIVMLFVSPMLGEFSSILTFLAIGACYGAYWLISSRNIEFEYAVTNGIIDVDKIIARKSRKKLISANCSSFEAFGKYKPEEHKEKQYESRMLACDSENNPETWYAVFKDKSKGRTLLVFNASERMLQAIKPALPKLLLVELRKQGL